MRAPGKSGHTRHRNRDGLPVPRGLNSQRAFGSSAEHRRKSRPRSAVFHGSSPCKRHRISSLHDPATAEQAPHQERGPRRRPSIERQTTAPLRTGHEHIRSVFPRRWPTCRELNRAYICVRNLSRFVRDFHISIARARPRPAFNTRTADASCVSVYTVAGVRWAGHPAVPGQLDAPVPPREPERPTRKTEEPRRGLMHRAGHASIGPCFMHL